MTSFANRFGPGSSQDGLGGVYLPEITVEIKQHPETIDILGCASAGIREQLSARPRRTFHDAPKALASSPPYWTNAIYSELGSYLAITVRGPPCQLI